MGWVCFVLVAARAMGASCGTRSKEEAKGFEYHINSLRPGMCGCGVRVKNVIEGCAHSLTHHFFDLRHRQ